MPEMMKGERKEVMETTNTPATDLLPGGVRIADMITVRRFAVSINLFRFLLHSFPS
jgi:hypothetical protein